jgi:hypothetical protein
MCRHRHQFRRDEYRQALNLIFNNKQKPGSGSGWTFNECRHSSKLSTVTCYVRKTTVHNNNDTV